MTNVQPCPFCGGTDIQYSLKTLGARRAKYHAAMYCNSCHCYGPRTITDGNIGAKAEAIKQWNRRATDASKK